MPPRVIERRSVCWWSVGCSRRAGEGGWGCTRGAHAWMQRQCDACAMRMHARSPCCPPAWVNFSQASASRGDAQCRVRLELRVALARPLARPAHPPQNSPAAAAATRCWPSWPVAAPRPACRLQCWAPLQAGPMLQPGMEPRAGCGPPAASRSGPVAPLGRWHMEGAVHAAAGSLCPASAPALAASCARCNIRSGVPIAARWRQ